MEIFFFLFWTAPFKAWNRFHGFQLNIFRELFLTCWWWWWWSFRGPLEFSSLPVFIRTNELAGVTNILSACGEEGYNFHFYSRLILDVNPWLCSVFMRPKFILPCFGNCRSPSNARSFQNNFGRGTKRHRRAWWVLLSSNPMMANVKRNSLVTLGCKMYLIYVDYSKENWIGWGGGGEGEEGRDGFSVSSKSCFFYTHVHKKLPTGDNRTCFPSCRHSATYLETQTGKITKLYLLRDSATETK